MAQVNYSVIDIHEYVICQPDFHFAEEADEQYEFNSAMCFLGIYRRKVCYNYIQTSITIVITVALF